MNGEYSIRREKMGPLCTASKTNITISKEGKEKTIEHYNYAEWTEPCSIPTDNNAFEEFVKQFVGKRKLVVHCDEGNAQTSVFAACLYALKTRCTDPEKIVNEMRSYRSGMVITKKQFDYICKFIARNCVDEESRKFEKPNWNEKINYAKYFTMRTEHVFKWFRREKMCGRWPSDITHEDKNGNRFSLLTFVLPKRDDEKPAFYNFLSKDKDVDGIVVFDMPLTKRQADERRWWARELVFDKEYWDVEDQVGCEHKSFGINKVRVESTSPSVTRTNMYVNMREGCRIIPHSCYRTTLDAESSYDDVESFIKGCAGCNKLIVHSYFELNSDESVFDACLYALKTNCTDPLEAIKKAPYMMRDPENFDFLCKFIARNCVDLESKGLTAPDWNEEIDYNAYFA